MHSFTNRFKARLADFKAAITRDERGVSAVEFALIAPLLILMLFGATEISLLVTVDRKTTMAASTLGDLASQSELVACPELGQIAAVTRQVFEPYTAANTNLVIANIVLVGGVAKVEWSKVMTVDGSGNPVCSDLNNSNSLAVGKTVTIDTSIFAAGGGVVVGDVEKVHTSIGTSFLPNSITLHERFYLRPRRSTKLKLCLDTTAGVTADTCVTTT